MVGVAVMEEEDSGCGERETREKEERKKKRTYSRRQEVIEGRAGEEARETGPKGQGGHEGNRKQFQTEGGG